MRIIDWFKPGIRIKRWILLGAAGIACICLGLSFVIREINFGMPAKIMTVLLIAAGCIFIVAATKSLTQTFFYAIYNGGFKIALDLDRIKSLTYEKRMLIKGPKIVAIGGGTGLSTMLRGLKHYSSNITAIVTVADDGGGSGVLRQDLGMLPPGDIRNCILALADTEPMMEKLLQYRFKDGMLKGQSFGNLFLAAMTGISTSFEEAVRKMSDVLAVTGRVLPVTLENVCLCAELDNGEIIRGESKIAKYNTVHKTAIKKVFLEPKSAEPLQEALDAIMEADAVILGPGSLYTSIIPNLLVDKVCDVIKKTKAIKIYVCNVMTQPGETDGYSVYNHIEALEKHSCPGIVDYCIVNSAEIPHELGKKYTDDGAEPVRFDHHHIGKTGIKIIGGNYAVRVNSYVRHDSRKLAEAIIDLVAHTVLTQDKKRIIDYYYAKDRLRRTGW